MGEGKDYEDVKKREINKEMLQSVKTGPMQERQCRDVLCTILFLANVVCMLYCTIYAYKILDSNPNAIFRGTDNDQNQCKDQFPYTYFYSFDFSVTGDPLKYRVCVKECPGDQKGDAQLKCKTNDVIKNCTSTINLNDVDSFEQDDIKSDTVIYYQSSPYLKRFCGPSQNIFKKLFQNAQKLVASSAVAIQSAEILSSCIDDTISAWPMIAVSAGVSIIVSFLYLFLMRFLAGCIVWFSVFGTILGIAGIGVILFLYSGQLAKFNTGFQFYDNKVTENTPKNTHQNYKYFAYTCWGISGVLLIVILCLCSRITLAIKVSKAAGHFISTCCQIMLTPLVFAFITVALWAACIPVMVYLVSASQFVTVKDQILTELKSLSDPALIRFYYFIFGTLWCNALVQAFAYFTIASSCALWYYSHGPGCQLHSPVCRSVGRGLRYHLGSLCFGSLILAIVQMIRLAFEFLSQYAQSQAGQNPVLQCLLKYVSCYLACLQRIVEFINQNAYIQIAITGKGFCAAASQGFQIVWSNPIRFGILNGIGGAIMFLGRLIIATVTTIIFYLTITYIQTYSSVINQPIFLLIVVFILSFTIGSVFMSVYSTSMDTIIVCFIIDEANAKQGGSKGAQFAPPEIAQLLPQE